MSSTPLYSRKEVLGPFPQRLYKYKPLNQYTYRLIFEYIAYFADPSSELNDIFDVYISGNYPKEKFINEVVEKNKDLNVDLEEIRQFMTSKLGETAFRNFEESRRQKFRSGDIGVFCLSRRFDNLAMWGHYADGGKGICIGFDTEKLIQSFGFKHDVMYLKNFKIGEVKYHETPPFDLSTLPDEIENVVLFRKSSEWANEEEVRIVYTDIKHREVRMNACIDEVIIGCDMDTVDRTILIGMLRGKGINTKVARRAENEWTLKIDSVNDSDLLPYP